MRIRATLVAYAGLRVKELVPIILSCSVWGKLNQTSTRHVPILSYLIS